MVYQDYRQYVLAKANGANVHTINGLLGQVLNAGALLQIKAMTEEMKVPLRAALVYAVMELAHLTGVPPSHLDLYLEIESEQK